MAKTKNVTTSYKRNKNGKLVKTKRTVNLATNTQKGANTPNLSKNQLKALQIKADKDIKLAQITSRAGNVANITGQVGSTVKQGLGYSNDNITKNNDLGVQQSVNGGLSQSAPSREDDDNEYIY